MTQIVNENVIGLASSATWISENNLTFVWGGSRDSGSTQYIPYKIVDESTKPGQKLPFSPDSFDNYTPKSMYDNEEIISALESWSDVANITFIEDDQLDQTGAVYIGFADIVRGPGSYTSFNTPYPNDVISGGTFELNGAEVVLSSNYLEEASASNPNGTRYKAILVHELGHAIGLSHPTGYGTAPSQPVYERDSLKYTVMSYFGGYDIRAGYWSSAPVGSLPGVQLAYPSTPMIDDILAAQYLYGRNYSTRSVDNIYGHYSNSGSVYDLSMYDELPNVGSYQIVSSLPISGCSYQSYRGKMEAFDRVLWTHPRSLWYEFGRCTPL